MGQIFCKWIELTVIVGTSIRCRWRTTRSLALTFFWNQNGLFTFLKKILNFCHQCHRHQHCHNHHHPCICIHPWRQMRHIVIISRFVTISIILNLSEVNGFYEMVRIDVGRTCAPPMYHQQSMQQNSPKMESSSWVNNVSMYRAPPMYHQHSRQQNSIAIYLHHHRSPMNQGSPMYQWYHQCITSIACNTILWDVFVFMVNNVS